MIDAIIAGRLYGKPIARTGRTGSQFVTAKVRVATRDGGAHFVSVVAFAEAACTPLLALDDGAGVAIAGELSAKGYADKSGAPQPSLDLVAHRVLTAYAVQRKREALALPGEEAA